MTTRAYTPEKIAARHEALERGEFEGYSPSGKIHCVIDNDAGYPEGSWMDKHIGPDAHGPCPVCGQQRPLSSMAQHARHHGARS